MDKMRRTMLILMLVIAMGSSSVSGRMGRYEVPRVNMIQRRSCYYEPYDKQLTCQCTDKETNTFLKLRLMFFIKEKGQKVRDGENTLGVPFSQVYQLISHFITLLCVGVLFAYSMHAARYS